MLFRKRCNLRNNIEYNTVRILSFLKSVVALVAEMLDRFYYLYFSCIHNQHFIGRWKFMRNVSRNLFVRHLIHCGRFVSVYLFFNLPSSPLYLKWPTTYNLMMTTYNDLGQSHRPGRLYVRYLTNLLTIIYCKLIYHLRSLFKMYVRDWSKSITCVLVTWQQPFFWVCYCQEHIKNVHCTKTLRVSIKINVFTSE